MWRNSILLLLLLALAPMARADERLLKQPFASRSLNAARNVRVYLPPSYYTEPQRRYPVLYLHDGQNVLSSPGTNICFGWGSWELEKTVDALCQAGKMQQIILVAVNNSSARYAEYSGRHHPPGTNASTAFENYASFLVQELKPKIDADFRTRPEPAHTAVMGSSLGGICSLVLAWEHPDVYGGAASLSGAFQVDGTNFLHHMLRPYRGKAQPTRLYLDSGVVDFTGGDDGQKLTTEAVKQYRRIGWGNGLVHYVDAKPLKQADLEKSGLRRDKWAEAMKSQHNEFYWRLRAWRALTFLFPPADK